MLEAACLGGDWRCAGGDDRVYECRGSSERYGKVTGIMGVGYFDLLPWEVTDDTAMTIAVAKGIICAACLSRPDKESAINIFKLFNYLMDMLIERRKRNLHKAQFLPVPKGRGFLA